jgi:hypothetical protein
MQGWMRIIPRSETASSDSRGCQQRAIGMPATGSSAMTWFVSALMQCSRCAASYAATNCPSPEDTASCHGWAAGAPAAGTFT